MHCRRRLSKLGKAARTGSPTYRETAMNASVAASARQSKVVRRKSPSKVRVEVGNGAVAPKVALHRVKKAPKVEVGNGAIAPKVAIHRENHN